MILKNKKLYLIIVVVLAMAAVILVWYQKWQQQRSLSKVPVYSTEVASIKDKLVPKDFPFEQGVAMDREEQRTLNGLADYTAIWNSKKTFAENSVVFEQWMKENQWNAFKTKSAGKINLSGQKNKVILNVFIEQAQDQNNIMAVKVQVNFSQANN